MKKQNYHKATFQERCKYDIWVVYGLIALAVLGALIWEL